MNDNVKLLYDELKDTYDLGSEDDFRSYLSDSNKREALRKELESDYEVGDSTSFSNYLGFGSEDTAETPDQPANNYVQPEFEAQREKNMLTPGTDEWRSRTVDVPGENPYNGQTYGAVYDSIISDFGKNIAHPDVDPYAEARAQIIQAGITDDMNPDEADNLALQIREGYANRYAGNNAKEMVSSLPDQVPDIDSMMDGLWYNRDLQGRIDHEARRLGLSRDNYINYFMKPQLAKALSDRYGYDVNSAQHIAGRLLSQEDHTMERVRQNEATAMIGQYAAPYIQNHFAQALSDADKVFQEESSGSMMTPYGNAGQMAGAAIRHWQATDPEKVWEQIKPEIGRMTSDILDNPDFIKEAEVHADEEGTDVNSWLFSRIVPNLASQIQSQFEQMAIEREMPKNTMEYLWANIQNSLIGTVGRIALESQARRRMKAEALQRTEAGQNPNYTPSFGAKIGGGFLAMAPDMMLPMGGPFGLISKISTKPVQGMSQALIADGMRPLLARMAQSSGSGILSLGAFEGVKGGVEGAFNGTEQGDYLNSRRSADDILMDTVKGIWEKGIPSGFAGSAMIGGPIGQKISNGRGAIANALGWGAQVGVDAAGATALNVIPRIAKGDITPEEIGKDFASNVGTFAALGLHSKAKEFASLADGGRAWNGVPFTKEEVRLLEDNYLGTFRKQIEEIEKSQKSINPVVERMAGIDPQERKRMLTENVGLMMYNDLMHNYAIPRETKVKVAQALGVDIPEYAAKPAVLDLMDSVRDKTTEVGLIDAMNFDYNKEGGVADKMKHGKPLDSYDLMLRLLFQDNAAYNEALKKLQSGGQLTDQEKELIVVNNDRLYQLQRNYMNQEMDRITSIFEREHNMKPGELRRMLDDLSEGKPVDSNLVGEFEDMLTRYNDALDKLRQPTEETETSVSENGTGSVSVDETPVVDEVPTEDAPKVNRVVDNAEDENPATVVNGESKPAAPPVNQETTTIDNGLLVNDDTGNIIEVALTDGSKAYLKSGDPENEYGRVRLVDAQGNPITIQDSNGYTIDRLPSQVIARDDKGNLMVSEVKPEAPAIEGSKPAETKSKSPEETITEEPTPAMSRIKTDENGEPVWEESAAEDTAAALIEDQGGNKEAAEMVDEEIADLSSRLSDLTKQDKGKNKKHSNMNERRKKKQEIKDIQEKLGYWNQVKNILDNEGKTEDGQAVDIQHSGGEAGRDREAGQVEIQAQGAEEKTGGGQEQQGVEGAEVDNGVSPVSDTNVAGGTSGVKPEPAPEPNAEQKVAQGTVKNNIGKQFEFMNQDGTRSEVVLNTFKDGNKVEVTRQDYDTDGNPKGDPYSQDLDMVDLGNSLVNGYMKPVLSTEERLREIYKGKLGMQNIIDVLTDAERQQLLEAVGKGDQEALHDMVNEFTESHREDLIMNERDKRNANVSRIMDGNGSREDKLRRVRKEFQGYDDAVLMLSDEAMQPTTLEEYIADLHSRQPKTGEGPLAYFSYEKDGRKVVGMQDETGHGTKSGGDTKGYAPWLAPKGKGMSLQQYAEQIHEQLPEGIKNQYSDQDVRNAILEVFGGAERPSDITTMVIKRGIIQAEQAARRMEEMWIDGVGYQKVSPDDSSFAGRLTRAKQQTNTEPSEGQKEAGNYKKGHLSFGGYDFVVENPEGSFRRGKDNSGKSWEQKMNNTYGYILGKKGKDGDHLDMFINDAQDLDNWNGKVYVVDQVDPETGKFDEHKIMYGFNSEAEARDAYLSNYEEGWQGLGRITGVDKDTFDKWLDSSDRKIKEFAEHSIPKEALEKENKQAPTDTDIDIAIRDQLINEANEAGVNMSTDYEADQALLDRVNGVATLSRSKKRALETAVPEEGSSFKATVISSADGAKVEKNLETLAKKTENITGGQKKSFISDVGKALNAEKRGSNSEYATFETDNGTTVTIRLADHNAKVSNFDYKDEDNGISIVISRKRNNKDGNSGIINDGVAHIVEYFYTDKILKDAYGNAYSDIVRSIMDALHTGEYNDPTGLAEREEVNADEIKQQKVEMPVFYSNAMKAIEAIKQEKATPDQWMSMLQKNGGLKAGEDKWIGLSDYLEYAKKTGGTVSKGELLDFIRDNQIEVEEQKYREYINLDDNPKMQEFSKEYSDLLNKYEEDRNKVVQEMELFNQEMYDKYGQGWANDLGKLDKEDRQRNADLTKSYNHLNDNDLEELAFADMVEKHGDDFGMAFEVNYGNGKLEPQMDMYGDDISDAAKHFLQFDELPINSTRLEYTTEGLNNKREIALTIPTIEPYNESDHIHFGDAGNGRAVAWIRFGDTTDKDGNKVLVIDEIQSKRHQDAREKGYMKPNVYSNATVGDFRESRYDENSKEADIIGENGRVIGTLFHTEEGYSAMTSDGTHMTSSRPTKEEALEALDKTTPEGYGVPDAPFEKNWHELAMKRMLRYAAENGYDKIAWTTGGQQAERYNIGTVIDEIGCTQKWADGKIRYDLYPKNGDGSISLFVKDGKVINSAEESLIGKDLSEVVGKDAAEKMQNLEPDETLSNDELLIGGEGMKGFYDQILPRFMDKYGKKWGVKVYDQDYDIADDGHVDENGKMVYNSKYTFHTIDVTPEMKESVMQGQPMFFKTPDGHAYGFTYKGKIHIDPRIATSETPIHEYGHLWAEMKRQSAPEEWNRIKDVLLRDKVVEPFIEKVKRDYPELSGEGREDDFIEEVLTQFSGKHGADKLRRMAEEIKQDLGGDATAETIAEVAIRKVKSILNEFWKGVADMMGWKYTNAEDIADAVLRDMLNGVNPREQMKEAANGKLRSQAEIERTLMGVHNLSEEKLRKVLKQGGLANPSLAVIDTKNHMHTDYGSISLIPKASMIDARTGRNAGTFTADAWPPTYPTVQKRMSDKGQSKFWKDIRKLNDEAGEIANHMRMAFDTWLDKEAGQERLAYWYLKEKGLNPETATFDNPYGKEVADRLDALTDDGNKDVRDLNEEEIKEVAEMYHAYMERIGEPVKPAGERIKMLQARMDPGKPSPFLKLQQSRLDELEKYGELLHALNDFAYKARRAAFEAGKVDADTSMRKAQETLKQQGLQQDFDKWLQDKADSYGIEEWLYSGTDDRTSEQKWVRNTLQNASRLMKKEGLNGAVGWSSLGNWIATVANKEKTLEGIRKNRKNLATTEEQHDAWKENWGNRLYPIVEKLGNGDVFNGDNVMADILEHKDYAGYYKREYGKELSKEDRATIDEFIKEVRTNFPTGYFETKFERPVMLDEFEIAVVPESTSPDIVEALKNAGLDVRTYDNTGTEDQRDANRTQATMDAVQGRDDIMFQMVGKEGAAEADRAEGNDERSRNLTLAEDSEKAGVDAKAIKLATGWERGADGQWRYEIPDADVDVLSKYKAKADEMKKDGVAKPQPIIKLGELLGEDNELFRYYPDLKKTDVLFSDTLPDGTAGSFDGTNIELNAKELNRFEGDDLNNENVYGTLLHEVQHAIQDIEGFARGGNLHTSTTETGINAIIAKKEAERARIKTELDAINKILSSSPEEKKDYADLVGRTVGDYMFHLEMEAANLAQKSDNIKSYIEKIKRDNAPSMTDAKDLYHRLAGEVEARNVTSRMALNDIGKRQTLATVTEDVPREDQVIIHNEGSESASIVDDKETIDRLEKEPKVKVYRAMQLIDGKLYPPMAAKRDGKLVEPIELGKWEQADEHPELADENGKFKLDKGNGKSLKAAYNPYIHTSTTMLNDQFSEAQNRDNLVVVEVEVPESELTSGYKADKAKDAVGKLEWKAGVIQGQLSGTREVILSRWDKPIRIVPTEEVAQHIADMIKGKVEVMPTNVVTPQQRAELEKLGVKFVETDNQGKILDGENAGKTYSSVYGKKIQEKTPVNPMSEDFPKFSKVRKPSPRQLNEEIRKEKEVRRIEVAKKRAADEGGIKEPNRASFEREASKRYRNDLNEWMVRHGLTGYRPTEEGPELDKWKAAETDREDPKPNIFDYTGEKEYREAYADYLEKIEKYKPEETAELTKDDLIVEREMQTRTPAQKIINGISTTLARDFNGEQASDAVREGILGRRKNIEDLSADDSIYINNLVQQTDRLAKEMSGDHWDGEDTFSRIMNEVERRKRGMDHISGKDIRDALPFLIEAPMRRRDIAHDINDELQQKGSPARVSGEDIKAARMPISELRDEAMRLLEINKMMANDGRTQMTSEEQTVYDRVKAGAQNVADAINAAADHQSVPLTSDDVLASLSNFIKRDVPANLKVTEDMPELQGIIGSIRDWYRTAYTWLDEAGMRRENIGYYEHYVNHVWDAKRSDAEAYDTLVANRQPTTSRNMRERQVRTYMEGIEAGLVPQFSDIADMMGDYSKKNILAWANKKMLSDLSFIDVVERNDEGEVTAIFPMMSSKAPVLYDLNKYKYYEVPGVGPLWVYKDAADNFSQIFEQYDVSNGMKIYDNMASLAKKIELSWSGFHAGALTEVYAVQNAIEFGPKKTAQYFLKYLIKDCLESGLSPAYANPEDYRSAARHYVKLGATDDYSAPAVQNMSDTMVRFINETRQALKNKGLLGKASAEGLKPIEIMATAVKLINEGSDKILWTWLHDGLKIATFKMMEERSRSTMDARFLKQHPDMSLDEIHKSKEYIDALDKQLDRDGQYVNDQYGGQHWELINISPKMLRRMRRFLLSPDWLVSTQRHFLGAFGYGDIHSKARLRDFNKFLKAVKGEKVEFDPESLPGLYAGLLGRTGKAVGIDNSWADIDLPKGRTRRMLSSILCYAIGVNIFYDIANNIVNAIMRNLDEQDELEKEKQQDGYVSKYKLMYPDGMKWFDRKRLDWNPMHMFGITNMIFGDYGMQGNALGKKTHVFGGHYDEGAEAYLRTGKQFKEFPDFWENEKGELEFPRPLINRLMGKANPNIRMLYNTLNYYTRWDKSYDDKQLEERLKKLSDNKTFIGVSAGLTKLGDNYKPFWVPTQDGKDWIPTDMVFPSSKGFSAHKAREYFEQFMRAGDEEGYMETVKACIMNGMTDEQIKKASDSARKAIESEQIKKDTEGSETLQEVMNRFDATKNLAARNRLYKKIYTELGNEEPKAPKTYEDFQEWFQDYMDGVDSDDLKTNEKYMERAKATDMAEEARVSQLTKQCKAIVHEINVMKEDGISADSIKAFSEQPDNKRLLDAWKIVNKYKNDRKKEPGYDHWKKDLGKDPEKGPDGKTHDDKWRMAKIRGMRKEMLTQIERLGD